MKHLLRIFALACCISTQLNAQDSTGLGGTPYQEMQLAAGDKSPYLLKEWYSGAVRTGNDRVHDGVQLRYDYLKDEVEYKVADALYRVSSGVTEFSIPSGVELYTFRSGYPAVGNYSDKSFYRVLYDGNTKLLKKYTNPIKVEKASATREMDAGAKLYLLKDGKMNPVQLNNRNSFLKLLTDERNKLNYVIKEQQLDFAGEDDLIRLLEEYDSYKAGRGGN